jgi:hypothetical protein
MKTLFLTAAAFAAFVIAAPVGSASAHAHHRHTDQSLANEIDAVMGGDSTPSSFDRAVTGSQDGSSGYHRASGFEQVKAACEAYADSVSPAYISPGSNDLNSNIAELGKTVGSWAGHSRAYDHCMVAQGYVRNQ